jgi:hypothetical protein
MLIFAYCQQNRKNSIRKKDFNSFFPNKRFKDIKHSQASRSFFLSSCVITEFHVGLLSTKLNK